MAEDFAIGKALVIPQSVLNNINKLDEKINLIASDSEKMATHFSSAMTRMGGNAGELLVKLQDINNVINNIGSINAKGIDNISTGFIKTTTEAEKAANSITNIATSLNKIDSGLNIAGLTSKIKELNQQLSKGEGVKPLSEQQNIVNIKRALEEELKLQKKSQEDLANAVKIAEEKKRKEYEKTYKQRAKLDSRLRRSNYQSYITSTEGSLRTADKANTYTQRAQAIKNLEAAIKNLRTTDANYQNDLARLSSAHKKLTSEQKNVESNFKTIQKSQRSLMNTSDQLMRKLALIFSVSQITGYVNKLIRVRGEFELQNTALASILQNKDKADKLFGQITELAVKSPFTLKELTTYTKSLSAYSVEYEKLYDTTKMLADVSAGLGVDMQRLILAFGQVKAANFLRGTETRQFTEAGINMLGELAKYYTELEGRIVSVGEVQERQFKRMISFQDVEQVFKRLTSSGGMFYNMQERQAETLAGMMSNLQDSIDIMLNDIGKSNEGTIKGMVNNIKSIIENWREVAWYIEKIIYLFGSYKAITLLATIGNNNFVKSLFNISKTSKNVSISIDDITKAIKTMGRGIASVGILLLISWLFDLVRQATKASRALNVLNDSLRNIVSTDSNRLNQLISSLDDLIARLKLSNEGSQERRDIISSLNNNYGEYINFVVEETTSIEKLTDAYDGIIKRMKEKSALSTLEKGYQEIDKTYNENLVDARKKFEKEIQRGLEVDLGFGGFKKYITPTKEELNDLFNILQSRIRDIDSELIDSSMEQRTLLQNIIKEYYGGEVTLSQDYLKTIDLIDIFIEKKKKEKELESNINSAYKETLSTREANLKMSKLENDFALKKKEIQNQKLSQFEYNKAIEDAQTQFELDKINLKLELELISPKEADRQKNQIINWATSTVKDVNDRLRKELSGYTEEDLSKVLITQEEQSLGLSTIQKNVKESWELQVNTINQLSKLKENNISIDEKELKNAEKLKTLYEKKAEILGVELETKKKSEDKSKNEASILKELINLIEDAKKKYEELNEEIGSEEASFKTKEIFKGTDVEDVVATMTFDASGMLSAIDQLIKKVAKKSSSEAMSELEKVGNEAKRKYETQLLFNPITAKREDIEKRIEDLFSGYEISLELQKTGVPKDLISSLFDIEDVSFDDLKNEINSLEPIFSKNGKKWEELWNKTTERIKELEKKSLQERLKNFSEYLSKSVDETKKVEEEGGMQISFASKLFDEGKINADQYANILKNIIEEVNEKINNINVEKFKESPEYIKAMGDMSMYTKKEVEDLIKKIEKLIAETSGNINPSDLKVYMDALKSARDQLEKIENPFNKGFLSEIKEIKNLQKEYNEEVEYYNELLKEQEELKLKLSDAQNKLSELQKQKQENGSNEDINKKIQDTKTLVNTYTNAIQQGNTNLNISQSKISGLSQNIGQLTQGAGSTLSIIDAIITGIYNGINATIELFNNLKSLADSFGKDTESGDWAKATSAFEAISEMNENVKGSWESFKSGDIFGASSKAIGAIISVVKGINKIKDISKENEIKREIEIIEELERSYNRLYDTIENGLSIDVYSKNATLIKNLLKEIYSYEAMIAAEKDKKNTDEDRINEWIDAIDNIYSKINDLYENYISAIGLDFKSISEQLGDAISEAFKNGEDAAESWGDSVNDIIADIVKNILVQKLIEPQVSEIVDNMLSEIAPNTASAERIKRQIDELKTKYEQLNNISSNDSSAIHSAAIRKEQLQKEISELEKQYYEALNASEGEIPNITQDIVDKTVGSLLDLRDETLSNPAWDIIKDLHAQSGDTMSSLQKGIEGLSEETGQALEALLNSMRFYVSDSNTILHNIYNVISMPNVENPFLAELKVQSEQLRLLYGLFNGIIKNVSGSGKAMSVRIV